MGLFRDTYIVNAPERTEYVTRKVVEQRAPTDASVKLLREMETAARQEVLAAVRLTGNGFECVIHRMADHASLDDKFRVMYALNGKRLQKDVSVPAGDGPLNVAEALVTALAEQIAGEILKPAFAAMHRQAP